MKIGRYLFRRFRPDNPRAEKWGAFWGFMLAMGWVFVFWAVEAVVVRRYTVEMCRQAGFKTYVTPPPPSTGNKGWVAKTLGEIGPLKIRTALKVLLTIRNISYLMARNMKVRCTGTSGFCYSQEIK